VCRGASCGVSWQAMTPSRYALPLLWLALVLVMGTAYFSTSHTGAFVLPLLKTLAPGASSAKLHAVHMVLRKLAHLAEYAVLALLWFRALLRGTGRTLRAAAWIALAICLACALVDETHQATIPTRSGSVRDFLVDVSGAAGVLILARGRREARERTQMRGAVAVEQAE
jgi:VanZ family protein